MKTERRRVSENICTYGKVSTHPEQRIELLSYKLRESTGRDIASTPIAGLRLATRKLLNDLP